MYTPIIHENAFKYNRVRDNNLEVYVELVELPCCSLLQICWRMKYWNFEVQFGVVLVEADQRGFIVDGHLIAFVHLM